MFNTHTHTHTHTHKHTHTHRDKERDTQRETERDWETDRERERLNTDRKITMQRISMKISHTPCFLNNSTYVINPSVVLPIFFFRNFSKTQTPSFIKGGGGPTIL